MAAEDMGAGRRSRERRALNMIWTAAGDYSLRTGFVAYLRDGQPDLYFNTVIGLAYRDYGCEELDAFFLKLGRAIMGATLLDLFWLGLEYAVYVRHEPELRNLRNLRCRWAEDYLDDRREDSMQYLMLRQELAHSMKKARCREVLGQGTGILNPWENGLYAALSFDKELDLAALQEYFFRLCKKYFFVRPIMLVSPRKFRLALGARAGNFLRRFFPMESRGCGLDKLPEAKRAALLRSGWEDSGLELMKWGKSSAEKELRKIKELFPRPVLSESQRLQVEQEICVGEHRLSHVYFAAGGAENAANVNHFRANARRYRLAANKLVDGLQNSLHLASGFFEQRADEGQFAPELVWQALVNNEERVFKKQVQESYQNFAVVLLLDGSYSRRAQQEEISAQAWLMAESMGRCGIPVLVLSYCTVEGYTVLQLLKDFHESARGVFNYQAQGWNRDGLAFRAVERFLHLRQMDNVLLFILSDLMPSDERGLPMEGLRVLRQYTEEAALEDTAQALKVLRKRQVNVAGIIHTVAPFEAQLAHRLFGRSYVHIDKLGKLSQAVVRIVDGHVQKTC